LGPRVLATTSVGVYLAESAESQLIARFRRMWGSMGVVRYTTVVGPWWPKSGYVALDTVDIVHVDEGVWPQCRNSGILVGFPVPGSLNILGDHDRRWQIRPPASYNRLVLLGGGFPGGMVALEQAVWARILRLLMEWAGIWTVDFPLMAG